MSEARAITIGAFDGVHLGHAALIRAARSAVGDGGRVIALTFEPHPLYVLRPQLAPPRLSTLEQRREWLVASGADEVRPLEPTPEFLGQTPREFLEWASGEHRPDVIVEGPDFRFGRDRAGSVETLEQHEKSLGYRTVIVDNVEAILADQSIVRVTSSLVRWLVAKGRVRDAGALLGRPYELRGPVIAGEGRGGAELGVPTANLDHGEGLLPADGIYAGAATAPDGRVCPAAISIGTKPTFGDRPRVCEAHLVGYAGGAEYGWPMRVEFHDWLRDQLAFASVALLIDQIRRDVDRVGSALESGMFCASLPQISR